MISLGDYNIWQAAVLFLLFVLLIKSKGKTKVGKIGGKVSGPLDKIQLLLMVFFTRRKSKAGQKESLYRKIHQKCCYQNSINTKDPFVLQMFGITVGLIVQDYEAIVKVLKSESFSDRAPPPLIEVYTDGNPGGILTNNGRVYKELKKYTIKKLCQLGFGNKNFISSALSDQLPDLLDNMELKKKLTNNKIQVEHLFNLTALNFVWCIIGGKKFSEDDEDFISLRSTINSLAQAHFYKIFGLVHLSKLKGVREIFGYSKYMSQIRAMRNILRREVDETQSLGSYKHNPVSFVDCFLQKIDECENDESMKDIYCKEQLVTLMSDLMSTGMDTTGKYLESVMLFMVLNPDVQSKVQEEIDSVVGTCSLPLYQDYKTRMPYTLATLNEIHRMASVVSMIPRITAKDVTIGDIHLKKGTIVPIPAYNMRFDDTYWQDPQVFRPERFLDDNNQLIQEKIDRMIVFGLGSRTCPASSVSRASSFTFTVGLLRKYTIRKADESEILGLKEDFGLINEPVPFHISLFERSSKLC